MTTETFIVDEEIQQLKEAIKNTNDKRMFVRYQTIILTHEGESASKIAQALGKGLTAVKSYRRRYKEGGITGLHRKPIPGKIPYLNDEQKKELKELITEKTPHDYGFNARMNWTCAIISALIADRYKIVMSVSGVDAMLKKMDLSYTRPTYCLAKADPDKQEVFKKNSADND